MTDNQLTQSACVVGGNAVSAFLSWRLSATNACDVTLVWKSGFDAVSQYGISFRSSTFGNERFKPRHGKTSHTTAAPKVTERTLPEGNAVGYLIGDVAR